MSTDPPYNLDEVAAHGRARRAYEPLGRLERAQYGALTGLQPKVAALIPNLIGGDDGGEGRVRSSFLPSVQSRECIW